MTEIKELKVEDIKKSAGEKACPVGAALYYVTEFLAGPMCGRCFPCAMGSYEARLRLQSIIDGKGSEADVTALKRIAAEMAEASMCKKGKDTAAFITAWINEGVFTAHVEGICPSGECLTFMEYRIIAGKCSACGLCKDACKHNAIIGEKSKPYRNDFPFEIRQRRCAKCGECLTVCPEEAIIVTGKRQAGAGV
jgi:ferredoxin